MLCKLILQVKFIKSWFIKDSVIIFLFGLTYVLISGKNSKMNFTVLGCEISDEEAEKVNTVKDAVELLKKKLDIDH